MDRAEQLATSLLAGLGALREGRASEAVARLEPVCDDRELARAEDLRDVRARACSLLAQALLGAGRPREAERRAEVALRLARAIGDTEGIAEITALLADIRGAHASAPRALPPSPEAVAAMPDPGARAEAGLQRATAALSAGDAAAALEAARRAWEDGQAARSDRVVVLARLCAAHADPRAAAAHLQAAWAVADASAEAEQLLGPVARAAEVLGLPLPDGGRAPVGGRP